MPMTSTSIHPDDETLAAFVDGTLPEPRRREVTEHLASCEDCYEIFAETARFLGEHPEHAREKDPQPARVIPFTRRGLRMPARAWIAAAAVLLVALAGAWLVLQGGPAGPVDPLGATSGELLALLDGQDRKAVAGHLWSEEADALAFSPSRESQAFSLGVHLVDARAALETGDDEAARRSLEALAEILLDSPDTDLSGAASDLADNPQLADLDALERRLAGEVPADRLALGRFVETARLAAAAGSEAFFTRPEVQEALVRAGEGDLGDSSRRKLETARTAGHLEEVETALADLIRLEGV